MTKRRWREGAGLTALNVFFIALCFLTLIPILYALSVSFSGSNSLLSSDFSFIPRNFTLKNYREVLFGENITLWFRNTIFLAVVTVFCPCWWQSRRPTVSPAAAFRAEKPYFGVWFC